MKLDLFSESLRELKIEYTLNEPMKNHTSFKIGGNADIFVTVKDTEELKRTVLLCKQYEVPCFVLGRGSNILVSDNGIEGAVISLSDMDTITVTGEKIICGAGASLSAVCRKALENSLKGLEFAYGIPGSVGGGLYMNAGAYGGEMSAVTESAEYVTVNGESGSISASDMRLGYRTSIFKNSDKIITRITLSLIKGDKALIEKRMNELIEKRRAKQPLEYPSAGSTFKRPEGYFAGALIEKNGLMGVSVGGASVSKKHAGFIINRGGATSEDVKNLIKKVQKTVLDGDGVKLEPEVIFIGKGR